MTKIRHLSEILISKIAAGEVIERPAYVIKELIENSYDAHATEISINLENAGLKSIRVRDNGIGMDEEDAVLSLLPHTTSKLFNEKDLYKITTLGFRGEALSSIRAVSRLTLDTRQENSTAGTRVTAHQDGTTSVSPIGIPKGTIIMVEDIFHTVPARKKFLRTQRTELRHCIDIVTYAALSYPQLGIQLTHNGKTIMQLPSEQNRETRIREIFGDTTYSHLSPLSFEDSYIKIYGMISLPPQHGGQSFKPYIFVNNRHVHNSLFAQAAKDAYGSIFPVGVYPLIILYIDLPHEAVDVNVHPKKEYVEFVDTQFIYSSVVQAIQEALQSKNLFQQSTKNHEKSTNTETGKIMKDIVTPWFIGKEHAKEQIFQLYNVYIVVQTKSEILFIDQHAAHERILYEQYTQAFQDEKEIKTYVQLQTPQIIELTPIQYQTAMDYEEVLTSYGIPFIKHGKRSIRIDTVSPFFRDRDLGVLITELLSVLSAEISLPNIDTTTHAILAFLSCRNAIKAGDPLTTDECQIVVEKLQQTSNNTTCPHGRPTTIRISREELDQLFHRT